MVIICIGTPKLTGDSVAPLTGEILIKDGINAYVYGTTARPVTGLNYIEYYRHIKAVHKGETVIAVDSALGEEKNLGMIRIVRGGVSPGGAMDKGNPKIGNYGILAQVGRLTDDPLSELMSAPYELASALAAKCARAVYELIENIDREAIV